LVSHAHLSKDINVSIDEIRRARGEGRGKEGGWVDPRSTIEEVNEGEIN
jgi:hypothetical protein